MVWTHGDILRVRERGFEGKEGTCVSYLESVVGFRAGMFTNCNYGGN